jgi:hypothetical protein
MKQKLNFLSEKQLNWKPQPSTWSVGECIRHLVASHTAYHPKVKSGILFQKEEDETDFRYKNSLIGKFIIKGVDPDNLRRVKTLKVFEPDSSNINRNVFDEFINVQNITTDLVKRLRGLDLVKIKISSPVNKYLRMNVGDPLVILPIHDTRHLNQALRVTSLKLFPSE